VWSNLTENHFSKPARVCGRKRLKSHGVLGNAGALAQPLPNQEVNVGAVLHSLRAERDLTLRALAEKSGLAMNTLSLIEHAKTSPCVATLQQLAFALKVPITTFFENGSPKNRVVYVKAAHRSGATFAHGMLEDLGVGLTDRTIGPFVVTMKPTASSGAQPIVHTGHEFVFCLAGRIVYAIEDKNYLLEPGDSILFESHLPHRWQNVDAIPARMLLVLCPADSRDQPTQRHFLPEALERPNRP
jgi:transcriptional regulator with XRE-family HTH domain